MVLLVTAALLALAPQIIEDEALRPLPVAAVLENPGKYDDRAITIVGSIFSTPEVNSLRGEGCRNESKRLDGRPWACAVLVNLPDCSSEGFRCNPSTLEVLQAYRNMRNSRTAKPTLVSMTGRFHLAAIRQGEKARRGVGHMGAFLAELIVTEAEVIPK